MDQINVCFLQKDDRLLALGRFFGALLDKFVVDTNAPKSLLYYIMTTRPAATHAFFFGMMCSNPDPYTMLPRPFDYCKYKSNCLISDYFLSGLACGIISI